MASLANEIRALLRLLDDDHPVVRGAVKERLASFGPELEPLLREFAPAEFDRLTPEAMKLLRQYLQVPFEDAWKEWLDMPSSTQKLERGLMLLAQLLSPPEEMKRDIGSQLDGLAADWEQGYPTADFRGLTEYLFGSGRFWGNEEDYYAPENSNLAWVLRAGRGSPILLACVMILVGSRRGITVSGCNFPSHFLARHESTGEGTYLIDCFNGGRILPAASLMQHEPWDSPEIQEVVRIPASAEIIISRVLRNLDLSFERAGKPEEQQRVQELWRLMAQHG
jgi:regulator of sirC expression with transglutaminase-like and TPR domain